MLRPFFCYRSNPPTSLAERIARLNNKATPPSNSSAVPNARTTGATGKLSDIRKRFDNGSDPLVVHGSFGLGKPSTGLDNKRDMRAVTLGSGRASLPPPALRKSTRSVSEEGRSMPATTSGQSSTSNTPPVKASPQLTPTAELEALDLSAITLPGLAVPALDHNDSLATGSQTPMSVSSMNVETGSDSGRTFDDDSTSRATSPLSSPVIEIQDIEHDDAFGDLKGPVAALRGGVVRRTTSSLSVSSLKVEVDDDVGNLLELTPRSGVMTPPEMTPEESGESEERNGLGLGGVEVSDEARAEEVKLAATNTELMQYEDEVDDLTAVGSGTAEDHRNPVLSTFSSSPTVVQSQHLQSDDSPADDVSTSDMSGRSIYTTPMLEPVSAEAFESQEREELIGEEEEEGDGGYGDILDDFDEDATSKIALEEEDKTIPGVKCSDCSEEVDLASLPDHTCSTAATVSASPPATASPPAAEAVRTPTLDDFVPQTTSLVPEDILDDEDDFPAPSSNHQAKGSLSDPYDIYEPSDDQPTPVSTASIIEPSSADVPSDISDSTQEELTLADKLRATSKLANRQSDSSLPPKSRAIDHNSDDEDVPGDRGWATVSRKH